MPYLTMRRAAQSAFIGVLCLFVFRSGPAYAANPYPYDTGLARIHFGDLPGEAAAAKEEGKVLTVYFWQEGCPYCDKLEKVVMADPDVRKAIEEGFYLLEVNIFGAKEIIDFSGGATTEKEFAEKKNIQFTPTLIFFSHGGDELFRTVGVWEAPHFMAALDYVRGGHYRKTPFKEFVEDVRPRLGGSGAEPGPYATGLVEKRSGDFRAELEKALREGKLLLVYFWKRGGAYCALFEKDILSRPKLRESIRSRYRMVELDAFGDDEIVWVDGAAGTGREVASRLGITDVPTVLFIGEGGEELFRMPGVWRKTTHFEAATHYVGEGRYKESSFQEYIRYVWFKPKDDQGEKE